MLRAVFREESIWTKLETLMDDDMRRVSSLYAASMTSEMGCHRDPVQPNNPYSSQFVILGRAWHIYDLLYELYHCRVIMIDWQCSVMIFRATFELADALDPRVEEESGFYISLYFNLSHDVKT